ncbi:MAG: DUF1638 domain-containing protein [Nitrospirota bacterium]|nr:DUF1638 domain-containing protein [Nitrospirota bacterium]
MHSTAKNTVTRHAGCPTSTVKIISCEVFRHELEHLVPENTDTVFLEQDLHQNPDDLRQCIQESIIKAEGAGAETIILFFGYCGGALEGIVAARANLVVPKAHDCISLILGKRRDGTAPDESDTFYLSGGWLDYASDPYKKYLELVEEYDEETARWCACEMMKAYRKLVFISNEVSPALHYREAGLKFAEFFKLSYRETDGDISWMQRLIKLRECEDVLVLGPGEIITRNLFS